MQCSLSRLCLMWGSRQLQDSLALSPSKFIGQQDTHIQIAE